MLNCMGANAGLGEDRDSLAAFLFRWPSAANSATAEPIKLPKVQLRCLHARFFCAWKMLSD